MTAPVSPAKRRPAVDPVGVPEIAERLDVSPWTVHKWRQRDLGFPEPRWTVAGNPAWHYGDVARWARRTGRA